MKGTLLQGNDLEVFGGVGQLAQERRFDPLLLFLSQFGGSRPCCPITPVCEACEIP
jgi:hypothetical protein